MFNRFGTVGVTRGRTMRLIRSSHAVRPLEQIPLFCQCGQPSNSRLANPPVRPELNEHVQHGERLGTSPLSNLRALSLRLQKARTSHATPFPIRENEVVENCSVDLKASCCNHFGKPQVTFTRGCIAGRMIMRKNLTFCT